MNCYGNILNLIIIFIIILLLVFYKNNNKKINIINNQKLCNIKSYVKAAGTKFLENNFILNHKNPDDFQQLKKIEQDNIPTKEFINNFLEMDYMKYFKNININKLENIEI